MNKEGVSVLEWMNLPAYLVEDFQYFDLLEQHISLPKQIKYAKARKDQAYKQAVADAKAKAKAKNDR